MSGLTLLIPFITGVINPLTIRGMSHQVPDFLSWDSHWTWCQGDSGYQTAREVNRVNHQHQDNLKKKHQVGHVLSWNDENHMISCIIFIKFEKTTLHIWQPYFTNKSYPTWHLLTPHFTDVTTELVLISWRSKAGDGPVTAWEGNCPRIKIEKLWKSYGFPFGKRVLYFYVRGQWDWCQDHLVWLSMDFLKVSYIMKIVDGSYHSYLVSNHYVRVKQLNRRWNIMQNWIIHYNPLHQYMDNIG